ncbi:hypothetical protein [Deinococcus sp. PEB2-63]
MDPRHIRPPDRKGREDWRGQLRPEYREADEWYRAHLVRAGLLAPTPELLMLALVLT